MLGMGRRSWRAIAAVIALLAALVSAVCASASATARQPPATGPVLVRLLAQTGRLAPVRHRGADTGHLAPARHRGAGTGHLTPAHHRTPDTRRLAPARHRGVVRIPPASAARALIIVEPAGPAPLARIPFPPQVFARPRTTRPRVSRLLARPRITRPTRTNPWFVRIPAIGVDAKLMVLGYPTSAALPVPPLSSAFRVGWYNFTSVPGQPGNVVLVGHVDTYLGPAVFYDLYLLRRGEPVYVRLTSRRYARYIVRSVREIPKASFPAEQIFSDTHARRLWLITCGGAFDYATHHYTDNIIVSASQ